MEEQMAKRNNKNGFMVFREANCSWENHDSADDDVSLEALQDNEELNNFEVLF